MSVRENIILALQAKRGMFKLLSRKQMEEFADKYIDLLQIKTASRETPIKSLSGGNQQKVIIARWLLTNPDYLILDEPTRGIDIGTKTEIQKLVLQLADEEKQSPLFLPRLRRCFEPAAVWQFFVMEKSWRNRRRGFVTRIHYESNCGGDE